MWVSWVEHELSYNNFGQKHKCPKPTTTTLQACPVHFARADILGILDGVAAGQMCHSNLFDAVGIARTSTCHMVSIGGCRTLHLEQNGYVLIVSGWGLALQIGSGPGL